MVGSDAADILIFSLAPAVPEFGDNTIAGLEAEDCSEPLESTTQDPTDPAE
jgi:hypothetical protein